MYENSKVMNPKKELMTLAIDLGENEKKFLKIYNDSNPEELAYNFCFINHLDYRSMNLLTDEVKKVFESRKNIPNTQSNEIRNSYNKNNVNNNYNNNDENLARFVNKKTPLKSKNRNNQIFQNLNDYSNYLSNNIDLNKSYNNYNRKNNSNGKNTTSKLNQSYRPATANSKRKITLSNNLSINDTNDNTNVDFYKKPNTYFTQNNYSSQRKNTISTNKSNYPISILINNKKNDNLNYGERLYHKCKKIEERKNNKIQQIKNEEEKKLNRECTFKPRINRLSYHAFTNRYNNNLKYDDEDNIIYYRDYIDRKLNYLKERYNKKDENCYFSPKINKTKEKDNKSIPRYEQLYQNSKQLKSKKEFLDKIYNNNSFKPSINKVYNTEITNLPFNERQNIYNSRTTERKKQMKNQMENNIDSKTGQKFFQPKINQNSHLIKRNNDTFNKLYSDHKKQSVKKQKYEKEIQERFSPLESFASEQSNEIYLKQKVNSFEKIFSILDKDQDGIISKFNVYTNGLDKKIQKIISPIIIELKEDNQTLNKEEFCAACFKLFDTLNYLQKKEVMNYALNKKSNKDNEYLFFTFKPKITYNYDPNIYYEKEKKKHEEDTNNNNEEGSEK